MILLIDISAKTCYVSRLEIVGRITEKNYFHFLRKICSQDYKIYRVFSGESHRFSTYVIYVCSRGEGVMRDRSAG